MDLNGNALWRTVDVQRLSKGHQTHFIKQKQVVLLAFHVLLAPGGSPIYLLLCWARCGYRNAWTFPCEQNVSLFLIGVTVLMQTIEFLENRL